MGALTLTARSWLGGSRQWDMGDPWRLGREAGPVCADAAAGCGSGRLGLAHRGDSGASQGHLPLVCQCGSCRRHLRASQWSLPLFRSGWAALKGLRHVPPSLSKLPECVPSTLLTMGPGDCEASALPPGPLGWVSPCRLGQGCGWGPTRLRASPCWAAEDETPQGPGPLLLLPFLSFSPCRLPWSSGGRGVCSLRA